MRRSARVLMLCLLAGCTVGPDYSPPRTEAPAAYTEPSPEAAQAAPGSSHATLERWWVQFDDPTLQGLIERALKSNLDYLTAASRVRAAREQVVIAGAAELPQVSASGLAARLHSNGGGLLSSLGGGSQDGSSEGGSPGGSDGSDSGSGHTNIKLYSVGFDATWEVDIFGGGRRAIEAAKAVAEEAEWQMRDAAVTLTAEVATDYLSLRAAQARIALLREEAKAQQDVLDAARARQRTGFATQLDVNRQEGLVAATLAQVPPLEAQARAMRHAIAVLLGQAPEAMAGELAEPAAAPAVPDALPAGLPSDLLRRRPDIRAAERALAAATAQVGVAVADLYPKFNLLASLSFASNHVGNLLSTRNLSEAGLGSIMWPIFNGGRIHANIRAKTEEADQAYYAYQKSVIGALRDVEDALARLDGDRAREAELHRADDAARSSTALVLQQYKVGTTAYVDVLTAQANELSIRDRLEQNSEAMATDLVSLYKALGGGWEEAAR